MKAASGIHTKYTLPVESVTVICYAKRYSFATVTASGEWGLHHITAPKQKTDREVCFLFERKLRKEYKFLTVAF